MLRPLLTYLLLINLFTISLLNVREELPVYQSIVSAKEIVTNECPSICKGIELKQTKSHSFPLEGAELVDTLPVEYENEIEIESHTFEIPFIAHIFYPYISIENQAYHMYEFSIIKIQHLDIFSPPPNC